MSRVHSQREKSGFGLDFILQRLHKIEFNKQILLFAQISAFLG
jgi:hypothetical protein